MRTRTTEKPPWGSIAVGAVESKSRLRIRLRFGEGEFHEQVAQRGHDILISANADETKAREAPDQTRALRTVSMLMNIRSGRDGSDRNPMPA